MLLQLQGLVSYATVRYEAALTHFTRAVSTNPVASGASVRMAVALCFYKLEQYDRARAAIEKCIQLDVSYQALNVNVVIVRLNSALSTHTFFSRLMPTRWS